MKIFSSIFCAPLLISLLCNVLFLVIEGSSISVARKNLSFMCELLKFNIKNHNYIPALIDQIKEAMESLSITVEEINFESGKEVELIFILYTLIIDSDFEDNSEIFAIIHSKETPSFTKNFLIDYHLKELNLALEYQKTMSFGDSNSKSDQLKIIDMQICMNNFRKSITNTTCNIKEDEIKDEIFKIENINDILIRQDKFLQITHQSPKICVHVLYYIFYADLKFPTTGINNSIRLEIWKRLDGNDYDPILAHFISPRYFNIVKMSLIDQIREAILLS